MTPGQSPECQKGTGIEESTFLDSALGTIRTKFELGKLKASRNGGSVLDILSSQPKRASQQGGPVDS